MDGQRPWAGAGRGRRGQESRGLGERMLALLPGDGTGWGRRRTKQQHGGGGMLQTEQEQLEIRDLHPL